MISICATSCVNDSNPISDHGGFTSEWPNELMCTTSRGEFSFNPAADLVDSWIENRINGRIAATCGCGPSNVLQVLF